MAGSSTDCTFKYNQCRYNCSDNCSGLGECHNRTGYCNEGCRPGFHPPGCTKRCSIGKFGMNCTKTCSNCKVNKTSHTFLCEHTTGYCTQGCNVGYSGEECVKNTSLEETSFLPYVLVGIVVFLLLQVLRARFTPVRDNMDDVDASRVEEIRAAAPVLISRDIEILDTITVEDTGDPMENEDTDETSQVQVQSETEGRDFDDKVDLTDGTNVTENELKTTLDTFEQPNKNTFSEDRLSGQSKTSSVTGSVKSMKSNDTIQEIPINQNETDVEAN